MATIVLAYKYGSFVADSTLTIGTDISASAAAALVGNGEARWGTAGPLTSSADVLPVWTANTVYAAGQEILDPTGVTILVRKTQGTSRSTYDATEQALWSAAGASGGSVTGGTIVISDTRPSSPTTNTVRVGLAYDSVAPTTPTGLAATPGNAQVALSWSAATDNVAVTGYNIRRNGTIVASPAGTSYTDTGLTNGTTYAYTVSAFDASGNESAQSSSVNGTPVAPGTTLATDNFNRTDGAGLGTSSGGQTWVDIVGQLGIRGNACGAYTGSTEISTIDVGNAGVTVTATFTVVSGGGPALIIRLSDANNFYQCGTATMQKIVAGSPATVDSYSSTFVTGDVMTVVCSGNTITVKRNGATVTSRTDTFNNTATKHGILFGADVTSRVDTFSITTP